MRLRAHAIVALAIALGVLPAAAQSYSPPGTLFDNGVSDGNTSLASQDSSGTLTARSADDFRIPSAGCPTGVFNVSRIRIQMVQADAAPQPFAVDIFGSNGTNSAPTPGDSISPLFTLAQTSQTSLSAFGLGTTLFEASFDTPGLQLDGDTTYWLSGYGATASANPSGFNNFFASSAGAASTTANGVIIAPGAGVATWSPVENVIGPPPLAFSFAVDGSCAYDPEVIPVASGASLFGLIALLAATGALLIWKKGV